MNAEPELCFDWDELSTVRSSTINEIDTNFRDTFCHNPEDSKLHITRFYNSVADDHGNEKPGYYIHPRPITFSDEIEYFAEQPDLCQIFGIYQKNTYSRLYITRELFERFVKAYSIFSCIWEFVLPFHFQARQLDIGHTPFRFRRLEAGLDGNQNARSFECAYSFRYVVLNQREGQKEGNPNYDPWSIRQTAIYQQYQSANGKMTFVLITPSSLTKERLDKTILRCRSTKKRLDAFDLHRVLISTLHENWSLYIQSLERLVKNESDRVTLAEVQSETESLSSLPDLDISFLDRQRMRMIKDKILDLVVIFDSLLDTLSQLQRQCRRLCISRLCENCRCAITIEAFKEQMHDTQVNLKRVEVLKKRAQSTEQLLSSFLEYRNAKIALLNGNSISSTVREMLDENTKMRTLTERSTRDSTAVKILTVITILYLPMATVANFFSTQLIRVDDSGKLSLVSESWWFIVVTVPLTMATFLVWKYWLSSSIKDQERAGDYELFREKETNDTLWKRSLSIQKSIRWMGRKLSAPRDRRPGSLATDMP